MAVGMKVGHEVHSRWCILRSTHYGGALVLGCAVRAARHPAPTLPTCAHILFAGAASAMHFE